MYHLIKKGKGFFPIDLYKGDMVDGKRHGFGIQLFPNGSYYIGYWESNQSNGRGKLVLPDNTYYEGIYANGVIQNGCVVYFNGARFEGSFDGTQYERFKNGTFTFTKGDKFKGEWKDGIVVTGRLFDREGKVWEFFKDDTIIRRYNGPGNYGIIVSKINKWFYEGGIENNDCTGNGTIYCAFQQYKTGQFVKNQIHGFYKKIGLNWGEITIGECEYDKRVGDWKRMLNKGILIETKVGESHSKVSFPFINEDYFMGTLHFLNMDKKPFDFKYKAGLYYFKLYTGGYKQINVANLDSVWEIKEVKDRGVNFQFTFEKIFNQNDKQKMANLKLFMTKLIDSGAIKLNNIHPFLARAAFPEEVTEQYSETTFKINSRKQLPMLAKSKSPMHRNITPMRNSKRGSTSNFKRTSALLGEQSLARQSNNNFLKTEVPTNNTIITENTEQQREEHSPTKDSSNLKKTILKYESKLEKTEMIKNDDIKETIVAKRDHIERSRTPDIPNQRMRFRSFVNSKSPDINLSFNPLKSNNTKNEKMTPDLKAINPKFFEKINSSGDEEVDTLASPLMSHSNKQNIKEAKKQVIRKDIKIIEEDNIDYFEGIIVKGKKQGYCKVLYQNGIFKQGNFSEDVMEGPGYIVTENLIEYSGIFVKDSLQGKGTIKLDGVLYEGNYINGKFKNDQVRTMENGTILVDNNAETSNEGLNGSFVIYFLNGFILEAELLKGVFMPNTKCKLSIAGQKYWNGRIIIRNNIKYFESLSSPSVSYKLTDEFTEYQIVL